MFPGVNVRAIVTGIQEGGRGDPQMDLGGASLSQQLYNAGGCGTPDDGIVNENHPLALHRGRHGI